MAPVNYTPIAAGADADDTTFNPPLQQLDDAIVAQQTKVAVSLDTDGTLKAGAVDGTSVLANLVVTNGKIADATIVGSTKLVDASVTGAKIEPLTITGDKFALTAFTTPNVVWDPLNKYMDPVLADEPGGKLWWFPRTQALLDAAAVIVDPDSANPFNSRTLRHPGTASTQIGKFIDISEAGLAIGSTVNFSVLVKPASASGTWKLRARCYKADGTVTSATTCDGVGFDFSTNAGAMKELTTIPGGGGALTIEALTAYVLVFLQRDAGSIDMDIYGWDGSRGLYAGRGYTTSSYPQLIVDLNAAKGTYGTLSERLDNLSPDSDAFGRSNLKSYFVQIAKSQRAVSNEQAVLAFCGDSHVVRDDIHEPLRLALQTKYGNAGVGWVGFVQAGLNSSSYWHGFTFASAGTWHGMAGGDDNTRLSTSKGIDIGHLVSSGTGGTITVVTTETTTSMVLQYYKNTGGGSFTWKIDAGSATTVSTAGAAGVGTVNITGLSNATHTLLITVTVAGADNVTLLGVDLQHSGNGVRVHKCGCSGSTTVDWTDVDATQWKDSLAALDVNTFIILLGTNDATVGPVPAATYNANLQTLIDRVHEVDPLIDVLVWCAIDNGTTSIAPYDTEARNAALAKGAAFLSGYYALGVYADANARGAMSNATHPNEIGGRVLADHAYDRMFLVS